MVWGSVVSHVVCYFKGLEELLEDLLFSLLSLKDIRMLASIICASNIVNINVAIVILINLVEGLLDHLLSVTVHGTSEGSQELIVLDKTTVVVVEVVE